MNGAADAPLALRQHIRENALTTIAAGPPIIEHKGDLHPQIVIEDAEGRTLDYKYVPERASIEAQ